MEHPNIQTMHLDDVPRSLARETTPFSDLTWHFGPRGDEFFGQGLGKVAEEKLGIGLSSLHSAIEDQEPLETAILTRTAERHCTSCWCCRCIQTPLRFACAWCQMPVCSWSKSC